jgi:hypothetical protein
MKHTKEQIIGKAKQIMKDLDEEFYFEDCTDGAIFEENYEIISGKMEGKMISCWTVYIKAMFDNTDHLFISDETGEPVLYHNFNMILFDIEKDETGKYYKVE